MKAFYSWFHLSPSRTLNYFEWKNSKSPMDDITLYTLWNISSVCDETLLNQKKLGLFIARCFFVRSSVLRVEQPGKKRSLNKTHEKIQKAKITVLFPEYIILHDNPFIFLSFISHIIHPVELLSWQTSYLSVWSLFGLVWFYGISTIIGYLMPNPFYTYISNIWFLNTFCW